VFITLRPLIPHPSKGNNHNSNNNEMLLGFCQKEV